MQAIIQDSYNGISDLKIGERADPSISPLSVIVQTKYTPVLPYDWRTETGELKSIRPVKLPIIIGYGFAGIVESVGSLRNNDLIGKKVIGASMTGSSSTIIDSRIPPLLFQVPDNVELSDAATIIGGADTALGIINKININSNDVVLITGASGGIGTYLIQLLKTRGVKVIAVGHNSNVEFLISAGADDVIDYTKDVKSQLVDNDDISKVIDTAGNIKILDDISAVFPQITIVSIAINYFNSKNFSFIQPNIFPKDYERLLEMLSNGKLHAYVQDVFDFRDVIQAQMISKNTHSQGRILLKY
ncbi:NADP-dependent oxidoreductase [Companilactobacillus jidongensis]|uniref:NADP-dependent oxidoreductase n=1 Tax=Companilactobacillus jidongensis TaxID=2486006 RepID=UPI000F782DEA|nr:NADP-dependent oxidoreductase [Companilactobacillus jidongensis]